MNRYRGCFFTILSPFSSSLFFLPSFHLPFPFGFFSLSSFRSSVLVRRRSDIEERPQERGFLANSEREIEREANTSSLSSWQNPHWINNFLFPPFRLHASFNFDARMRDFVGSCRWNASLGMMRRGSVRK